MLRRNPLLGRLFSDQPPPMARNPLHSALLSALFPGLGQAYNYQILRGLIFAIVFILFIPLILPAIFLWCAAIYDAYRYAEQLGTIPESPAR